MIVRATIGRGRVEDKVVLYKREHVEGRDLNCDLTKESLMAGSFSDIKPYYAGL